MNKYNVIIEEHISQTFSVDAKNIEEAMCIAEEKYRNSEFIVDDDTPTAKLMSAYSEDWSESTEWKEF